jgi:hypothetical protein
MEHQDRGTSDPDAQDLWICGSNLLIAEVQEHQVVLDRGIKWNIRSIAEALTGSKWKHPPREFRIEWKNGSSGSSGGSGSGNSGVASHRDHQVRRKHQDSGSAKAGGAMEHQVRWVMDRRKSRTGQRRRIQW